MEKYSEERTIKVQGGEQRKCTIGLPKWQLQALGWIPIKDDKPKWIPDEDNKPKKRTKHSQRTIKVKVIPYPNDDKIILKRLIGKPVGLKLFKILITNLKYLKNKERYIVKSSKLGRYVNTNIDWGGTKLEEQCYEKAKNDYEGAKKYKASQNPEDRLYLLDLERGYKFAKMELWYKRKLDEIKGKKPAKKTMSEGLPHVGSVDPEILKFNKNKKQGGKEQKS